jgi:hypothetical protein
MRKPPQLPRAQDEVVDFGAAYAEGFEIGGADFNMCIRFQLTSALSRMSMLPDWQAD